MKNPALNRFLRRKHRGNRAGDLARNALGLLLFGHRRCCKSQRPKAASAVRQLEPELPGIILGVALAIGAVALRVDDVLGLQFDSDTMRRETAGGEHYGEKRECHFEHRDLPRN